MLDKKIIKKKKRVYKKKHIGIILLYHYSPSLIKRKQTIEQNNMKKKNIENISEKELLYKKFKQTFCKNPNGNWYSYNDSFVKKLGQEPIITNGAYVLFYRRK